MSIFFSCIGTTDPCKNYYDGPVLHVLRNYPDINKVYLFMSKEMWDNHLKTDMYNIAFEDFKSRTGHNFEVVFIDSQIIEADDYDKFYEHFKNYLGKLLEEEEIVYINISSGTPAMTTSLLLLAVENAHKNVKAVQVRNPLKRSDSGINTSHPDYDVIEECLKNEDFALNSKRCVEPKLTVVLINKARNQLYEMLNNYNYEAALNLYNNYSSNNQVKLLISHAKKRLLLQRENKENILKLNQFFYINLYPIKDELIEENIEYYLLLQTLVKTKKTTEFLLRLHPFIKELQLLYLKKKCNIDMSKYIIKNKNNKEEFSRNNFQEQHPDIMNYLNQSFNGYFNPENVSIFMLNLIIQFVGKRNNLNNEELQLFETLHKINDKYRNRSAHELFNVSDEILLNDPHIKIHSSKLLNDIWLLLVELYGDFVNSCFDMYDVINDIIMTNF